MRVDLEERRRDPQHAGGGEHGPRDIAPAAEDDIGAHLAQDAGAARGGQPREAETAHERRRRLPRKSRDGERVEGVSGGGHEPGLDPVGRSCECDRCAPSRELGGHRQRRHDVARCSAGGDQHRRSPFGIAGGILWWHPGWRRSLGRGGVTPGVRRVGTAAAAGSRGAVRQALTRHLPFVPVGVRVDRVVHVLRQPRLMVLVGLREPRVRDVHVGQAPVELVVELVEPGRCAARCASAASIASLGWSAAPERLRGDEAAPTASASALICAPVGLGVLLRAPLRLLPRVGVTPALLAPRPAYSSVKPSPNSSFCSSVVSFALPSLSPMLGRWP